MDGTEDANHNGFQDKNADGTILETDPLLADSDADGLSDGTEDSNHNGVRERDQSGNWLETDSTNPDSDSDGLRDGQETVGWTVTVWYERTMEKRTSYAVTSNPLRPDTDGDGVNDYSEFLNGSDPSAVDTDGDGIPDRTEIDQKSNVTGIEGTPPIISNVQLNVA